MLLIKLVMFGNNHMQSSIFYLRQRIWAGKKTEKAKKHPEPNGNLLDADVSPRKAAVEGANV